MSNLKFIDTYLQNFTDILNNISREDIEKIVNLLYTSWQNDKQIFIAGNGGSVSTATHFVCDLSKFTSVEGKKRFRAIALTDNAPWISALTNDIGWDKVYVEQLKNLIREGDTFVAISVHGGSGTDQAGPWSQNLLAAAKFVKENNGKVVGFVGFDGGFLKQIADACVVVPVNSTPQVEGFHVVLTHLICARLRELIAGS